MTRDFWKFWKQAQGRMETTVRYYFHSNRGYQNPKKQKTSFKKDAQIEEGLPMLHG